MSRSLINAYQHGQNQIVHIFAEDGQVHRETVNFHPFLGYQCGKSEKTSWTDMYGNPVKVKVFPSIKEMNDWKKQNKELFNFYGDVSPVIQFIASEYRKDIVLDKTGMKIFNIDIEVFVEGGGFPKAEEAAHPINAITINEMISNTYTTFAYHPTQEYIPAEDVNYIRCSNELDLLTRFLEFWNEQNPQVVTGWNINIFDIPYLVNRINNVMGPEAMKKLSCDRKVSKRTSTDTTGREIVSYKLQGHIIWDYIELYKKYTQETREQYTLDHISSVELGDNKVDYHSEYESLNELYLKDYQKFITYNIKDTSLIRDLDHKLDYINLAMSIMQKAKCQPEDIFGTVRPWDCIIYNELLDRKMLCPPNLNHTKSEFVGGYVGEPVVGLVEWLFVKDIVSSYPNNLISFNMSPETIINDEKLPEELLNIRIRYGTIEHCVNIDDLGKISDILRKYDVTFTSNGQFFTRKKRGILPSIFAKYFDERVQYKDLVKKYKAEGLDREAKIADLYQYTLKILLNSGYGALANNFSRYFDIRIAEAITSNGQVCVRGATKAIVDAFPFVKNVYNDTDSCFLSCEELIKKRFGNKEATHAEKLDLILKFDKQCIQPELTKFFNKMAKNMNMERLTIAMEAECVADVSLFLAKKKYIMNKIWDEGKFMIDKPKRKIRGVEIVRSSTPKVVREKLKEAVELIFTTKSNDVIMDLISDFKKDFVKMPIDQVSFPRSVTFAEYNMKSKSLPIGVNAAFTFNEAIKNLKLENKYQQIADGDKIKFCYIKEPNICKSHVIGFINKLPHELNEVLDIDYELQFEKAFLAPLTNILDSIGWKTERRDSFEDFFA